MRFKARIDGNHNDVVKALRAVGATVQSLASIGSGCPDLLVGWQGRNYLIEVKASSKHKLTEDQIKWHEGWRGGLSVANSTTEALAIIGVRA